MQVVVVAGDSNDRLGFEAPGIVRIQPHGTVGLVLLARAGGGQCDGRVARQGAGILGTGGPR